MDKAFKENLNSFARRGFRWLTVILVFVASLPAHALLGQALPAPPKGINGYTISIKDSWVGSTGFRPVRVTIATNPVRATVDDEKFEISYRSEEYRSQRHLTSTNLVIPAGSKSATVEIYVNDMKTVNSYDRRLTVYKSGRQILSTQGFVPQHSVMPTYLIIGDEFPLAPELRKLVYRNNIQSIRSNQAVFSGTTPLPSLNNLSLNVAATPTAMGMGGVVQQAGPVGQAKPNAFTPWTAMTSDAAIHYCHPDDLPASWIGYESIERVLISWAQFKRLNSNSPLHLQNLAKWVAAGGALIVYDTGPEFKNAGEIWPQLTGETQRKGPSWKVPSKSIKNHQRLLPVKSYDQYYYGYDQETWVDPTEVSEAFIEQTNKWVEYESPDQFPTKDDKAKKQDAVLFGICEHVDGRIVAVSDNMSKWSGKDWGYLHNSLVLSGNSILQNVTSTSPEVSSSRSFFSIPGVGEPPRGTFQILIGLFLLVAGPVTMLVLKRTEKMQYLFVAVPLLSLAVCSSLFLYAMFADGSKRWGRVSSSTHLDHRSNVAVTHTRTMYYCGTSPGDYEMEADSLGIAFKRSENNRSDRVAFQNGLMSVGGGDIAARMPHEMSTVRPYSAKERLLVTPVAASNEPDDSKASNKSAKLEKVNVQNRLGGLVEAAVIKTGGKYFYVQNLAAGESVECKPVKLNGVSDTVAKMIYEFSPNTQSRWAAYDNRAIAATAYPANTNGVGEQCRIESLIRRRAIKDVLDAPNCYVAILQDLPMVSGQIEPVEYKLQCHVVRGKW